MRLPRLGSVLLLCTALLALPAAAPAAPAPDGEAKPPYRAAILLEADTGQVLEEHNADERLIPASIVKMMVMLVVTEAVEKGIHKLDETVITSRAASKIGGSQVYLKEGEQFSLGELLKTVAVVSANDSAHAIAEHVAGSTQAFVQIMNERAKQLGMKNTLYHSVHGLPPGPREEADYTSARDTALLAREVVRHPLLLKWTATIKDSFRDGKFGLLNTNSRLLRVFRGMDGIKTGYYDEAGFNLCATAKRGDMRLISVVLGSPKRPIRDRETSRLLLQGFRLYKKEVLFAKVKELDKPVPVQGSKKKAVLLKPERTVPVLVKRLEAPQVKTRLKLSNPLQAPLVKGQKVGEVEAVLGDQVVGQAALVATEDAPRMSLLDRLMFWRR